MEVTLKPDNRKATIISGINDDLVKVRLEDGREFPWPISKINMPPKEGEEALRMVVVPAIDRLDELLKDYQRVRGLCDLPEPNDFPSYNKLKDELREEAVKEFKQKWGL